MNIERLKYFLDLTSTLNYTETAERFFTTQSNISKQIISLEKELNTILFSREHRKIMLTDAGRALLPYADKILSDHASMLNALLPFQKNTGCSTLRIGAIPVMTNYNVTGFIAEFHRQHPDIKLDVSEVESIHLLKELNEGNYDIAYIRIFEFDSGKYEKITMEYDQFAAVLPLNHPLAKKEKICLLELRDQCFLQLDRQTQLIHQFYALCRQAGFEPNVSYTGTRIDNILDFVSQGMGISLMMQNSISSLNHPGIVIIPLDITINSELAFIRARHQHHSPASNIFWKFVSLKGNPQ